MDVRARIPDHIPPEQPEPMAVAAQVGDREVRESPNLLSISLLGVLICLALSVALWGDSKNSELRDCDLGWTARYDTLQEKLASLDREKAEVEQQLKEITGSKSETDQTLQRVQSDKDDLNTKFQEEQQKATTLEGKLELLDQQKDEVEKQLKEITGSKSETDQTLQQVQKERNDLSTKLRQEQQKSSSLEKRLNDCNDQNKDIFIPLGKWGTGVIVLATAVVICLSCFVGRKVSKG